MRSFRSATYIIAATLIAVNVTLGILGGARTAAASTTSLLPTFDTQISAARPTSYYPNSAVIYSQSNSYYGFFRFDISSISSGTQQINSLTFRPYINYVTTSTGVLEIYAIDGNWNDRSTWNNSVTQRAACGGTPIATIAIPTGKMVVDIDLPISIAAQNDAVNICTTTAGTGDQIRIASMNDTNNPPQLLVNASAASNDTTPPSTPQQLAASATTATSTYLEWQASVDDTAIAYYEVFRNGTLIMAITNTSYEDTGLSVNTTYTYSVRAIDAGNNASKHSAPIEVSTLDEIQPIVPTVNAINSGTSSITSSIYETSSITAPNDSTLLLYITAGRTDGNAAYPQTISGLNATWQLVSADAVGSGNLKSAIYKTTNAYGYGTISVDFGSSQQNFSWHLAKIGSSEAVISQPTTYSGTSSAPEVNFLQGVGQHDVKVGFVSMNSATKTIDPANGAEELGISTINSKPSVRTTVGWQVGTGNSLGFMTSGSYQKTVIGLVVTEGDESTSENNESKTVAVIGDSLTYQDGDGVMNITNMLVDNGYSASNTYVYAAGGKAMTTADSRGKTTLQNISEARSALGDVDTWVIALGTNNVNDSDTTFQSNVNAILNTIGGSDTIIWIGMAFYGSNNTNASHFNPITIGVLASHPNAHFADWNSFIHNGRDETGLWAYPQDYTHMSVAGYLVRNQYYIDQINALQ